MMQISCGAQHKKNAFEENQENDLKCASPCLLRLQEGIDSAV